MAEWLRELETAWMRRNVPLVKPPIEDEAAKPVCIITGGNKGIGRHLANEFGARGHRLLLVAQDETALEKAAGELRRDYNANVFIEVADLTQPDYQDRIQNALNREHLYADIVVNNAAIGIGGPFAENDPAQIVRLCRLNMEALTMLTRIYLPDMVKRARGGILNVASLGGFLPGPYQAAYYASKAYVLSLTEALAYENTGHGVRICAAAPGPVLTGFHERMGTSNSFYLKLLWPMEPYKVAQIIYSGFAGRRTIIVPGVIASVNSFFARYIPHPVLSPAIGWILKQRY